ncbi:MAG: pyruvate, phosphate dikinase [Planctomycetes bacterium]|nr:pyruvate, phosphate dikinase [Planctomycetota bacterium]
MPQYVYFFGGGKAEGRADMKNLLGGKGANLAEMTNIGLPVPAGFSITTEVCTYFYEHGRSYPDGLREEVAQAMAKTEGVMGTKFGDTRNPLLVSCRSGARVSMPGMMDTVLNIGLNEKTVHALIERSGNERFGWDSYRRFVQMYGDVVLGLKPQSRTEHDPFEVILDEAKKKKGVRLDTELTASDLKDLVKKFKAIIRKRTGKVFPEDPQEQLWGAIGAVFHSWMNDRAVVYRRQYGIPHDWGTAVNICSMVFGNMGNDSATGVAFTRDPATGEKVFYGEYLINAQGEDVVAGIRTPKKIAELQAEMPDCYRQLEEIRNILEKHYRDVQDIEFTVQKGRLWMLQTRNGKRTGFAGIRFAVDMVHEGLIRKEEALSPSRIPPDDLNQLLQPIFDPRDKQQAMRDGRVLAKGINAGPGAASGKVCFHAEDAERLGRKGEKVILCRRETSPEDIRGMQAAQGILTAFGGASSHAALVSRQMGKVCVVGCSALQIDYQKGTLGVGQMALKEGDWLSIDGFTGDVVAGQVATQPSEVIRVLIDKSLKPAQSEVYQRFAELMSWADSFRKLRVRTNADLPDQARTAVAFGAEGIGLCRTEHMFFEGHRIDAMREMILASDVQARKKALAKLLPYQRRDFEGIFKAMEGHAVTIRTLDPPLHEFLPHTLDEQKELAKKMGATVEHIRRRVQELHEFNPMLGHRGCRLGIVYPEITEMQCRAIFEAACNVKKAGLPVQPEIMIPLVGFITELASQSKIVHETAKAVFARKGISVPYLVGTMIELPRACVVADQVAKEAQFFSFGTNDLTQTTLGVSRDDYGTFIHYYLEHDLVPKDPFQSIDEDGVGGLMRMGVEKGRKTRAELKVGICGEHGGDPATVRFCHRIGLNYVSCSPFRVPIARLAAAQAALYDK